MNVVDLIVLTVGVLALARGWRRGFLSQLFELGGGFLGLLAGMALGPTVAGMFTERPGLAGLLISIAVVLVGVSIGQTLGFLIGHRFGRVAAGAQLGNLDHGMGAGFGVLIWILSFWLIGSMLANLPLKDLSRSLRDSAVLRVTSETLPPPPDLLARIRQYLDTSGFPQVFAGLPRSVSPPVDLPSDRQARRAVRAAEASTVRIVARACGGIQLGSGWISDDDSVVTNAHVVAGAESVVVQELASGEHAAEVVLFDPRVDIAVLSAPGITAPALPLQTDTQERGTPGATLGYPGSKDGRLVTHKAAVQAAYQATGRDIYGNRLVEREVYELLSPVRQGDSGGPFVLPSGEVAGTVFAASTSQDDTGYALTGAEIADQVRNGSARTSPVGTGRCTR